MKQNTIKLPSDMKYLDIAEKIIEEISTEISLNDEIYGNVLLSLSEALINAIIHGNKFNATKKVTVHYEINNDELEIVVADEGNGFNPDELPDPTAPENLEKLHSRGVYIIRHLCDKIEFEYNNGQIVKMYFKIK